MGRCNWRFCAINWSYTGTIEFSVQSQQKWNVGFLILIMCQSLVLLLWQQQCSLFLIARHSVCNSLQFFQWLVMLQCCGQNYGFSVSQLILSEAIVGYNQSQTHHNKQISSFCCHGNNNSPSPEQSLILVWASSDISCNKHSHTNHIEHGD